MLTNKFVKFITKWLLRILFINSTTIVVGWVLMKIFVSSTTVFFKYTPVFFSVYTGSNGSQIEKSYGNFLNINVYLKIHCFSYNNSILHNFFINYPHSKKYDPKVIKKICKQKIIVAKFHWNRTNNGWVTTSEKIIKNSVFSNAFKLSHNPFPLPLIALGCLF